MEKTCRTCLNTSLQLIPLFDDSKLITAIEIISSIKMEEVENYPNQICGDCVKNINIFLMFQQTIISSDRELREKLFEEQLNSNKNRTFQKSIKDPVSMEYSNNNSCDSGLSGDDIKIEANDEICDKPKLNVTVEEDCKISIEDTKIEMDIDDKQNQIQLSNDSNRDVSVKQKVPTKDCNICGKIVKKTNYSSHMSFHSNIPAKCDICEKPFKNKACLTRHIFKVHKFEGVTCPHCGKTFRSRHYFKGHLQKKHNNSNEEVPKVPTGVCNICGKMIGQTNLLAHIRYHEDAPVTCDICGKKCRNPLCLRDHIKHHKRKELNCEYCGKIFKQRQHLKLHIQDHKNIPRPRKHKCSVCDKALSSKQAFLKHMRSHTGERPYVCEFCEKGFTSRYALKTHRRQHTNEKPYKCDLCDMAYPQKVSLVTHMKSKHSQDVKN